MRREVLTRLVVLVVVAVIIVALISVLDPHAAALAQESYRGTDPSGNTHWFKFGGGALGGGVAGTALTKSPTGAVIGMVAVPMGLAIY